jgi:hypothetical protein
MRPYGLCLLIPPGWDRMGGDEAAVTRAIGERWSGYHLTDEARSVLREAHSTAHKRATALGVVLWAVKGAGTGAREDPLSILSLTVAVNQPIGAPNPGDRRREEIGSESAVRPVGPRRRIPTSAGNLSAAMEEQRFDTTFPGLDYPVPVFQAQAFVVPKDMSATVTVTSMTPDPAREAEARQATIAVASTLRFQPLPEHAQP